MAGFLRCMRKSVTRLPGFFDSDTDIHFRRQLAGQIERGVFANRIEMFLKPIFGGSAAEIAQIFEKRPFRIDLGRCRKPCKGFVSIDAVHADVAILAMLEPACFDKRIDEGDRAEFAQESGIKGDFVDAI